MDDHFIENLNKLRLENEACDVIIKIGQKSFVAHRVILMARAEYFKTIFTTSMRDQKEIILSLEPETVNPDVFDEILNYFYTSKIQVIFF